MIHCFDPTVCLIDNSYSKSPTCLFMNDIVVARDKIVFINGKNM